MSRHWVYHPKEAAKIVDEYDREKLLQDGWFDSPAKFEVEKKQEEVVLTLNVKADSPESNLTKPGKAAFNPYQHNFQKETSQSKRKTGKK